MNATQGFLCRSPNFGSVDNILKPVYIKACFIPEELP
jgi:hypothetical protein